MVIYNDDTRCVSIIICSSVGNPELWEYYYYYYEATPISVETASEDRNVVLFKSIPVTTVPIPVNLLLISWHLVVTHRGSATYIVLSATREWMACCNNWTVDSFIHGFVERWKGVTHVEKHVGERNYHRGIFSLGHLSVTVTLLYYLQQYKTTI